MKVEKHYLQLKESLEVIDESISHGILLRQRTIGFNCSAAASDMLEIFLHTQNLIDPGFIVKHDFFSSKNKIKEKFYFDFENKDEILNLMNSIEQKRNDLCYGAPKGEKEIKEMLNSFNKLKKIFEMLGVKIDF